MTFADELKPILAKYRRTNTPTGVLAWVLVKALETFEEGLDRRSEHQFYHPNGKRTTQPTGLPATWPYSTGDNDDDLMRAGPAKHVADNRNSISVDRYYPRCEACED